MIRAAVFDFDGVVLESVEIKTIAFRRLFADHPEGERIVPYHLANGGISRFRKFQWFYEEVRGEPLTEAESERLGARFSELVLDEVRRCAFVPGARELLERLAPRLPLFVASGTPEDELRGIVAHRELGDLFAGVYGTPPTKAEILRRIMDERGLDPAELVFVGDAMSDFKGAAAGRRAVRRALLRGRVEPVPGRHDHRARPRRARRALGRAGRDAAARARGAVTDVAAAAGYAELEERYLDRARAALAGREIERVLADRLPPPAGSGAALAGWWVAPDARAPLVVLPNPWDDAHAVAAAEACVWSLVGTTVERVAAVVEPRRGPAEWHLLLGPWLVHAGSALLDRLLYVRAAAALAPGAPVLAAAGLDPPATMGEAVASYRTDAGNRELVGALARLLGLDVQAAAARTAPGGPPSARRLRAADVARLGALAAEAACLSLARSAPTTFVGGTPLRIGDAARLAAGGGGLWLPPPWRRPQALAPPPADPVARAALAFAGADPATPPGALWALLPALLPRSVLEGRNALASAARRRYGPPRNVVVCDYAADETQNTFLADCLAAGRRLTFAQHGGFYLQAPVNAQERLEVRPDSTFLSWGATGDRIVVAPSPRLTRLRDRHRGGDRIVLIEGIQPPDTFLIRFGAHPLANQAFEHDRQTVALVRGVSHATRERLVLKRFPSHLPDVQRAPELAALPHDGPVRSRRAVDWMAHAALVVVSYPDTPFIEALLIGTPTIGLWPARRWPLREDAREPFARLARLGVVFDDPDEAAAQLDAVAADPGEWWRRADIQAARSAFLSRFAAIPRRPLAPWLAHLRDLRREPPR